MQRAVAIALAGGLLAASAGAFALAQVLKLERSPIEAIRVDPTPNHGHGRLDRHDSALFSPRCIAPCLRSAEVRFRVHTAGPVRAEVVASGGRVVRSLGVLPHPRGRVAALWNGRDAAGKVAPDGTYRMKISVSGRTIELLNPLVLDTRVRLLGTNVSRRVISPDCDSYGDRVIAVVRGSEQLAGVRLEVRKGDRLVRTVRVGRRARALAVSWPPYDGKRCTSAPDGRYRLRVIARDVPGNTRAVDLGAITARGVALSPPDRSIVAGKRVRIGISADARGLRLELARLGDAASQIAARGARAPAAIARIPPAARGGVYVVSNRHAGRTSEALLAVRGARPARVALLIGRRPASVFLPFQRRLDALGIRFDAITLRDAREGVLDGYKVVVVPAVGGSADALSGIRLVTSLAGIKPGLGT
ncbi:MAG: hypothetical protein QOE87_3137 [Gaiellales bacterium]|nr:hypothetical protein [Gaiellales bacterium]